MSATIALPQRSRRVGTRHRGSESGHLRWRVSVRGLRRRYGTRVVIDALDLDIHEGEFVALLGESGCGKTTLLRALAGLDLPDAGQIRAPERPSVVFQEPRLLPWATLWENVALGHETTVGRAGAARALAEVGLSGREDDWPRNLSGGQAQRVALARASFAIPHYCCWTNHSRRSTHSRESRCTDSSRNSSRAITPACCS